MTKPWMPTIVLSVLLIGSNLFWLYGAIDQSVSLKYSEMSFESAQSNYEQILVLANKSLIGLSAIEAIELVGKDIHGLDPFIKEKCLIFGQICLRLNTENIIEGFGEKAL